MKFHIENYIDEEKIEKRIKELAEEITKEYKGKNLKVIGILKGSVMFMSELIKRIDNENMLIDYMQVSSYGAGTESNGIVKIVKDLDSTIEGDDVLIVEDIIDSGYTLKHLKDVLETRKPNSIKICTLLDKPYRRKVEMKSDYVGFEIEDKFVVGYGMDFDQKYRNLPSIGVVVFDKE